MDFHALILLRPEEAVQHRQRDLADVITWKQTWLLFLHILPDSNLNLTEMKMWLKH